MLGKKTARLIQLIIFHLKIKLKVKLELLVLKWKSIQELDIYKTDKNKLSNFN